MSKATADRHLKHKRLILTPLWWMSCAAQAMEIESSSISQHLQLTSSPGTR